MKYIDAEKLKAHIQYLIKKDNYELFDVPELLSFIDSHQQEQPSLPSNLDEAAEEYAYNNWEDNDYHTGASEGLPFDAIGHTEKCFKAGAKWQKEQDIAEMAQSKSLLSVAYANRCFENGKQAMKEQMMKETERISKPELTWDDIAKIDALILEANNEFAVDYSKEISRKQFYTEVLDRFNKLKEKKK